MFVDERLRRILAGAIALFAWAALFLQLYLTLRLSLANGRTLLGALAFYFSFFTVLTNTLVAVVFTAVAAGSKRRIAGPGMQTAATLYIVVVGIVYVVLLRALQNLQGLHALADISLHYVTPAAVAVYWLLAVPKGTLGWGRPLLWLIYPLVYFAYSMANGVMSGTYPYPFINVEQLGYASVFANAGGLVVGFLILGWGLVGLDRLLGRMRS